MIPILVIIIVCLALMLINAWGTLNKNEQHIDILINRELDMLEEIGRLEAAQETDLEKLIEKMYKESEDKSDQMVLSRLYYILENQGITTIEILKNTRMENFENVSGIGKKSLEMIRRIKDA